MNLEVCEVFDMRFSNETPRAQESCSGPNSPSSSCSSWPTTHPGLYSIILGLASIETEYTNCNRMFGEHCFNVVIWCDQCESSGDIISKFESL